MINSINNVYCVQVTTGDLWLFLITNKLVENITEQFSLASLEMFRAFLRGEILCKVK